DTGNTNGNSEDTDEPTDNSEDAADSTDTTPAAGDGAQSGEASADPASAVAASVQPRTAAGEDNPAEPEPSIPEDQVEVEAYAIPAGSAYIHEISKDVKYNNSADNNGNAINEAMADALTYLRDLYMDDQSDADRVATIVVEDGLYLGGLNLSEEGEDNLLASLITELLGVKNSSSKGGELTIRIVAHDAIVEDEQGKIVDIHAESQGNVKLEGGINIDIDGLNTLLAGLYLSARDTVSIKHAGSVEYYGTQQDDTINLSVSDITGSAEADKTHILVDSGAGNDTVTLEVRRKPNVSASVEVIQDQIDTLSQIPSLINPDVTAKDILDCIDALKGILVDCNI
ncbi:MAG: hypothetical protein ACI4P4_13095, partial [Faecousia sp.]